MTMLFSFKGKIRTGYLLALILLLLSYILIFYSTYQLHNEAKQVTHTYIVINKLDEVTRLITEAETGVRGYIITKDIRGLDLYHSARNRLPATQKELSNLVSDNPMQLSRMDTLSTLLDRRLSIMAFGIHSFQEANLTISPAIDAMVEKSRNTMDSIRFYAGEMKNTENGLLQKRSTKFSGFFDNARNITILSFLIAVVAILYSLITYNQESSAKKIADERARRYGKELESHIVKLKATNNEIKELKSLEKFASTGRVARTIAHEVRNPLTNISLAAEQLQEMAIGNPDSSLLLEMISRNSLRINQLISDLLNATKFVHLELKKININNLLDATLELAKDRIDLHHIKVEKHYSPGGSIVTADTGKMKMAFLNIIVNAIESTEVNKGVLKLYTRQERNKCIVEINDNGSGMDEDTLQKLFEPFFTGKQSGYGLGLTNTQNIILSHKGNIRVNSQKGQGTNFQVMLDLA